MKWKQPSAQVLERAREAQAPITKPPDSDGSVHIRRPGHGAKKVPGIKGFAGRHRTAGFVVAGIIVLLIAVRACLPWIVKDYVNRQLNKNKDYGGSVGDVSLQLYRGQYRIHDIKIFKKSGQVHTPLFSATRMYLAVEWKELFHGSVVGEVRLHEPHVNFVSGPTPAQSQAGTNVAWNSMLQSLFPFDINRLEIIDGQVHFQNEYSKPPVDIYLKGLMATATNLSNSRSIKGQLPAGVVAKGTTIGGGSLDLNVQLNPMAKLPTYQLNAQLTNVDLPSLNSFMRAYGKFDVAHGIFNIYTSVASKDGNYEGYVKVFFNHLDVFEWKKERTKNVLQIFWDAVVGTAADILKNQPKDSLATRVPISGTYKNSSVGVWSAMGSLLQNAFIHALVPKIDEHATLQKAEEKHKTK